MIDLRLGDCLEVLKTLQDNSVDSVVCDPPYHLTSTKGGKKGFMGKEWDGGDIAFRTDVWKECLRVLKPGGYLLAFGSSRTYHRIAVAIEDAGFDIRDQIMWIYSSGFPKSHNIGKAIDKIEGNERKVIGDNPNHRNTESDVIPFGFQGGRSDGVLTKGDSEWEGWGTALKPAHEPIVMARKPLSEKSVAENVIKWGTGGINIDDSRVGYSENDDPRIDKGYTWDSKAEPFGEAKTTQNKEGWNTEGRFPANIMFEDNDESWKRFFYCPKASKKEKDAGLDNMELKTGRIGATYAGNQDTSKIGANPDKPTLPKKNTHPTIKPLALMEYLIKLITRPGGVVLDCFMGSGSTGLSAKRNGYSFIGIEKEQEYFDIAQQRINHQLL